MAGRNGGVGGEDALAAHLSHVDLSGRAQRTTAQLALKERLREQRRVPLVHVIDVYFQAERIGHARTAHTQHNLLLQAVVGVAAIQVIGEPAIPAGVAVQVSIQQIYRHHVSVAAFEVIAPGAHGDDAVFH